jgi:hypothetical protein
MYAELPTRFKERICIEPNTDCWFWTGSNSWVSGGYGQTTLNGKTIGAHRAVYEQVYGLIADGLELDHLCQIPSCVNPSHLEPVPHKINLQRGGQARRARTTECKRGHAFTSDNSILKPDGRKQCRTCTNIGRSELRKRRVFSIAAGEITPTLRKTHCPAGHAYDEANTRMTRNGNFICRTCHRERERRHV